MRASSVRSEIERAVAVMRLIGRSARPATIQPAATEASVTSSRAPPKASRTWLQRAVVGGVDLDGVGVARLA